MMLNSGILGLCPSASLLIFTSMSQRVPVYLTMADSGMRNYGRIQLLRAPVSLAFGGAMALVSVGGKGQSRTKLP